MSHTPHTLAADFPDKADKIHALKLSDAHFAKLVGSYHDVNRAVHRAESRAEPMDAAEETRLRKTRAALKDEIWRYLAE